MTPDIPASLTQGVEDQVASASGTVSLPNTVQSGPSLQSLPRNTPIEVLYCI